MQLPEKSKYDEYVKMGLLRAQTDGVLTIYQYTELTQYDRLWNTVTLSARGIVFDYKGRLIQRCLPKFFNHDEPEGIIARKTMTSFVKPVVQDKLDGSLVKVVKDSEHGLVVTSKASFQSKQAVWAKEIIHNSEFAFADGYTYHFELIHPENQIVLNYGDRKELVLLAIIENETGKDIDIYTSDLARGFALAEKLSDDVLSDINKLNAHSLREGVVANFGSYRLKYKTDEYVRLHRIVTDFTPKRVWEALSSGQEIDRQNTPEEFTKFLEETERELLIKYAELFDNINQSAVDTKNMTDKELGLSDCEFKSYLFALRKGKDISPMVWKAIKPKEES